MDREDYLEMLKKQYSDEIHELYLECEHDDGRSIDYESLNAGLRKLMSNAKAEGLSGKAFDDLVRTELNEIASKLSYLPPRKPQAA